METDPNADPGAPAPEGDPQPDPNQPRQLEDLLADLPDDTRATVLGEVEKARKEAKGLRARLKLAEPKVTEYDRLAAASKTEAERALEAQRAADEKVSKANARIVKAEVKALASSVFADPEDAAAFLDLDSYVDGDGDVDTGQIKADLDALLRRKPHLGRNDRPGPRPDPSQGSGGNGRRTPPTNAEKFADFMKPKLSR